MNRARQLIWGEEARLAVLWAVILSLIAVALGTVISSSWSELPRPEIVVETCSFFSALLIVVAQHTAAKSARRQRAMKNVITEFIANAVKLSTGEFMRTGPELYAAISNREDGVRYYYSHLATMATEGAILSGALDSRQDQDLVEHLNRWVNETEACNRRFMMSELRLFSTASDDEGVRERVRIHVSIATGPAVRQRNALQEVAEIMITFGEEGKLPKLLRPYLEELRGSLGRFKKADEIGNELQKSLGFAGRRQASKV